MDRHLPVVGYDYAPPDSPTRSSRPRSAGSSAERNAVILAHYYQESEIQDLADFVGDSLQLSQAAAKTKADVIVFCGVHFMAETAKILNPDKIVVVPDLDGRLLARRRLPRARCSQKWLEQYPGHSVVSYINCSAEVKALSDVICTSSNAVKIVEGARGPEDRLRARPAPRRVRRRSRRTGPRSSLWQGTCIVHETFSEQQLLELMAQHPDAEVIAHPECDEAHPAPRRLHVGSTTGLLDVREEEPEADVHRRDRGRHPAPDAAGRARARRSSPRRPRTRAARATCART